MSEKDKHDNMDLNTNNMVTMNNALMKGKQSLSLQCAKLLRLAIMQVVKDDKDLRTYSVKITDLAKSLKIDSSNLYRSVDELTNEILSSIIFIGDPSDKKKWIKFQWASLCKYDNGTITIRLHDNLKPYILGLNQWFTQYQCQDVLAMDSIYSIRMYELFSMAIAGRQLSEDGMNVVLMVDEIKMACDCINEYSRFGDFRLNVIDRAIKEIRNKCILNITYTYIKDGRKVIGFIFHISYIWNG